ncbi:hypothetical protein DDB_G0291281 [Dictyostelium discoideum AX4]|uniref:Glutaredoxin-like protein n=1 Tax=Dictyostelium discoideum TaxID=44689 RepID=GLRXL_DICDI|nr:hypothetical protein DDB_G0291281 [Dictyostelium discoideum AX4]Q54EX7.1 RecName: Full=Glutaredoxin-like protein [Dictyostelium discoideum]EAL61624.1 hypothetical protein DDB_G0291281 [Dictyostelium discoideum AX4]|eukprot:XP_635113.1 hypothetical protein DDB_G0291281 [Dictyostelium discoideum AX4]
MSTNRRILTKKTENISNFINNYHSDVINEVEESITNNRVVVVGMAYNPHVSKVNKVLGEQGVQFKYLEYGSYFSMWSQRLSIKMFTGFPTYPQVFVDGTLIGGCDDTIKELNEGTLFNDLKKK